MGTSRVISGSVGRSGMSILSVRIPSAVWTMTLDWAALVGRIILLGWVRGLVILLR